MKKTKTIIEIGACSLMDYEYDKENFSLTKFYNRKMPRYSDKSLSIATVMNPNYENLIRYADTVLITVGNKGPRKTFIEHDDTEISDLIETNLFKVITYLQYVIRIAKTSNRLKPLNIVIFNSVSAKPGATYENHAIYAGCKTALTSIIANIELEERSNKFEIFNLFIPYTQSSMTEGNGEKPDKLRKVIEDITTGKYNNNLKDYL